jgi:DNA-directed RNA polymerase specialized sigma24 family protein
MKKRQKDKGPAQLYLEQIEEMEKQIDRKKDKAERLYCLATKSTASMSAGGASGGGNHDKAGGAMDSYMDLVAEIKKDEATLKARICEAYDLMARLPERHYKVLEHHYLYYKKFKDIAAEMNYSERNVTTLHGRALQLFGKALEEHNRRKAENAHILSEIMEECIKAANSRRVRGV